MREGLHPIPDSPMDQPLCLIFRLLTSGFTIYNFWSFSLIGSSCCELDSNFWFPILYKTWFWHPERSNSIVVLWIFTFSVLMLY